MRVSQSGGYDLVSSLHLKSFKQVYSTFAETSRYGYTTPLYVVLQAWGHCSGQLSLWFMFVQTLDSVNL